MFTQFTIPVRKDEFGGVEVKQCVVSDSMLPVMADIIDAATHPVRLTATYTLRTSGHPFTEDMLTDIRRRVRYDLERQIQDDAKKSNRAVITEVTIDERPESAGVVGFFAEATAMPFITVKRDGR